MTLQTVSGNSKWILSIFSLRLSLTSLLLVQVWFGVGVGLRFFAPSHGLSLVRGKRRNDDGGTYLWRRDFQSFPPKRDTAF